MMKENYMYLASRLCNRGKLGSLNSLKHIYNNNCASWAGMHCAEHAYEAAINHELELHAPYMSRFAIGSHPWQWRMNVNTRRQANKTRARVRKQNVDKNRFSFFYELLQEYLGH
jgi:hypothetical protein